MSCWEQAEALQHTRRELSQLEEEVREQQLALEQLAAERDACKSGAYEASERSKVGCLCYPRKLYKGSLSLELAKKTARLRPLRQACRMFTKAILITLVT